MAAVVDRGAVQADGAELREVVQRELLLLDPAVRRSPHAAGELIDPAFREFGSSGRVWDRAAILEAMARDEAPPVDAEDVRAVRLAEDVVLLTYRSRSRGRDAGRGTLRSSVWRRRSGGRWRVVFHQGTVVPDR